MNKGIFHSKQVKAMTTTLVALSLLMLALPCNCMAIENPKPAKKEHPCHSSSDTPDSDTQQHNNCCCNGNDCPLLSEVDLISWKNQVLESDTKIVSVSNIFAYFVGEWLSKDEHIRGSPLTHDFFSYSSKTLLIIFQRWLI